MPGRNDVRVCRLRRTSKSATPGTCRFGNLESTIVHMSPLAALRAAAAGLASHPQDHGWRSLYGLFLYGLNGSADELQNSLIYAYRMRPLSATHLLTLLGIALKANAEENFEYLASEQPQAARLRVLEEILRRLNIEISRILLSRQNSFTGARRFLVPRVLLSAYFIQCDSEGISFADLGTGLGILPRQINSKTQYDEFAPDLEWPDGVPRYQNMPVLSAFGVDRHPMPTLEWVRNCYGSSAYYDALYDELEASVNDPEVKNSHVEYRELDLLDSRALVSFIREHRINAANLCYVLYEMEPDRRKELIDVVTRELFPPALLLVTEPREELHREGCVVEVFSENSREPMSVCFVSDGHFKGYVIPLDDYADFIRRYPIESR
jgi:hypothetical protein